MKNVKNAFFYKNNKKRKKRFLHLCYDPAGGLTHCFVKLYCVCKCKYWNTNAIQYKRV